MQKKNSAEKNFDEIYKTLNVGAAAVSKMPFFRRISNACTFFAFLFVFRQKAIFNKKKNFQVHEQSKSFILVLILFYDFTDDESLTRIV